MTDSNDDRDWTAPMVGEHFNPPPPTPRDEIWAALERRLEREAGTPTDRSAGAPPTRPMDGHGAGATVLDLDQVRSRRALPGRRFPWGSGWMAAAAAAILAMGVGLGRWSRMPAPDTAGPVPVRTAADPGRRSLSASRLAAVEHLSRAEPLLSLVKADVARGDVDPAVGEWARELLGQTRFLLDSGLPMTPEVTSLLEDLELVLVQATLVAGGGVEGDRAREELELLGEGLEDRNVLPRIQALVPASGMGISGS